MSSNRRKQGDRELKKGKQSLLAASTDIVSPDQFGVFTICHKWLNSDPDAKKIKNNKNLANASYQRNKGSMKYSELSDSPQ